MGQHATTPEACKQVRTMVAASWGIAKSRGLCLGAPIIKAIVYRVPFWGSLFMETPVSVWLLLAR